MRVQFAAALLTFASLVHAQGGAPAPPPTQAMASVSLPAELDRVLRDYEKAWSAKDPAALAALFAEDGFVLQNGRPPARGRDAIRAAYSDGGGPLSLRAFAWSAEGSTGYIIGGYASSSDKPDAGKFILALKRGADGKWLIAADIDNANTRPRPPAPAPPAPPAQ